VLRLGNAAPYLIQAPRPLYEINSLEYAVALFETMQAEGLLIAGAHPMANDKWGADVTQSDNKANVFNVVSQVMLRESGKKPLMVVQSRTFGIKPDVRPPDADVLLAFATGESHVPPASQLGKGLLAAIARTGMRMKWVDGSPETAGYEVGQVPQSLYLNQTDAKEFTMLWLSPLARVGYRQIQENRPQLAQLKSLSIPLRETGLASYIQGRTYSARPLPTTLKESLGDYLRSHDILILDGLRSRWPNHRLEAILDRNSRQGFLAVFDPAGHLLLVANLFPSQNATRQLNRNAIGESVQDFVERREAWLQTGGT